MPSSLPCTITRKITSRLHTSITQNHQKIELYGSPTTKEIKKPQLSRWIVRAEMQICTERHRDAEQEDPHPHVVGTNWEAYLRNKGS